MTDTLAHAKLSASGAHRWAECPASVRMEQGLPDTETEHAEYGTAAHEMAALALEEEKMASDYKGQFFNKCKLKPEGHLCDEEMIEGVQTYLNYVRGHIGTLYIEKKVKFDNWVPEGWGTADAIVVDDGNIFTTVVRVIDLKFGMGVQVDAEENYQAVLYGLGVLQSLSVKKPDKDVKFIVSIVQPRKDHISEWELTYEEILAWGEKLKKAAKLTQNEKADFSPGPKQCMWCKVKATCRPLQQYNLQQAVDDFDDFEVSGEMKFKNPETLSVEEVGNILLNVEGIVKWTKAVEAYAKIQMSKGVDIPGSKLVSGRRGHKKWRDEEKAIEMFDMLLDTAEDELFDKVLKSPAQAEKLLKVKGISEKLIQSLFIQSEGGPTIARASDKRPPLALGATSDFEFINGEDTNE